MAVKRYFVNVTEDDIEQATRKSVSDCMIHRAVMRAVGNDFHANQVQVGGHDDLGFYIQILPYQHVMAEKGVINNPYVVEPEEAVRQARWRLQFAPYWNRQVNPKGFFLRLGKQFRNGTSKTLNRPDIDQSCWFWDNGYTVKPFSFVFEVETRPEWDYHQIDLFPWYEYSGVNLGRQLVNLVDEALLVEHIGVEEARELVAV